MVRGRLDGSELVAALGLVFVVSGVTLWLVDILPTTATVQAALYELVVHVLFGGVVLALGVHIERSELSPDERFRVMVWCFSGFLFLLGLAIWSGISTLLAGEVTRQFVSDVVVFGSMGGAFGVIAGVNHGRSLRNGRLAARNETQRETLVLLTRLLRHDIRNDMTVINGHAQMLADQVDPDVRSELEVIQRRSQSVVRLLRDTDTLMETLDTEREFEPVDLAEVLDEEVAGVAEDHPEVTVESDVPDDLWAVADMLVHQLFSNLLGNAVAHNETDDLTIRVRAARDGDVVQTVVADDGGGIPPDLRADCFELGEKGEDSQGDGLGLYLVSRLADVYGGSVTVEESREGGARFDVLLPAADPSGD